MKIKVTNPSYIVGGPIVIRCPDCGNSGTFQIFQGANDILCSDKIFGQTILGHRKCPNTDCNSHVFFIATKNAGLVTYPPLRIDFDSGNIPERIKNSFEEAITCHANKSYMAAGIMIRRTLEELCVDRGALGANLKQKVNNLQGKVILPVELFEAMDELRLLGNDAAHIESKEYDQTGNDETSIGIELTKEILKSVYQMNSLVNKLKALKTTNKT